MGRRRDGLRIEPLTPELLPRLEELLGRSGPSSRCWCMYWRIGAGYRRRPAEDNHADFVDVVRRGPPPGLLAFSDSPEEEVVGWCQVTPRTDVPALDGPWRTRRVDDLPVWAITCFHVARHHRRTGVSGALVEAAVALAREAGAPAVEAYPLDGEVSPSATSTGYASTFATYGFREVVRRSPERPVMRLMLGPAAE